MIGWVPEPGEWVLLAGWATAVLAVAPVPPLPRRRARPPPPAAGRHRDPADVRQTRRGRYALRE